MQIPSFSPPTPVITLSLNRGRPTCATCTVAKQPLHATHRGLWSEIQFICTHVQATAIYQTRPTGWHETDHLHTQIVQLVVGGRKTIRGVVTGWKCVLQFSIPFRFKNSAIFESRVYKFDENSQWLINAFCQLQCSEWSFKELFNVKLLKSRTQVARLFVWLIINLCSVSNYEIQLRYWLVHILGALYFD
jgi:hypothetical protein